MSAVPHHVTLQEQVDAFPFWYHRIELPGGVTTPGFAPICKEAYQVPEDLTGKRVLDIGAWDGHWSFEALKRGASEVVAIDDFSDYIGTLGEDDRRAWQTFDLCRDALGFSPSVCHREEMSVYEVTEDRLGRFDVVFAFGLLYHLRHPLLALDLMSGVCDDEIYVESAVCDDFSPYRGGLGHGYPGAQVVMEFYPNNEYGNNVTNWWCPNLACLGTMLMSAGWDGVEVWKLSDQPTDLPYCRGFAKGRKLSS